MDFRLLYQHWQWWHSWEPLKIFSNFWNGSISSLEFIKHSNAHYLRNRFVLISLKQSSMALPPRHTLYSEWSLENLKSKSRTTPRIPRRIVWLLKVVMHSHFQPHTPLIQLALPLHTYKSAQFTICGTCFGCYPLRQRNGSLFSNADHTSYQDFIALSLSLNLAQATKPFSFASESTRERHSDSGILWSRHAAAAAYRTSRPALLERYFNQ